VSAGLAMRLLTGLAAGVSAGGLTAIVAHALREGAAAYNSAHSSETSRQFEDLFLFVPPRRIAEAGWACAAAAFLLVSIPFFSAASIRQTLVGVALGAVAAALALQGPRKLLAILRVRRRRRFNDQLVEALSQMSNALKAGFSITQSFEAIVANGENPISQEFDAMLRQMRVGVSFAEALQNLSRRVGSEDLDLVCTAIDIARRTGGNLTEIFDTIAATIRERIRIEQRIQTLTAQGRLQGLIVGAMPAVVLAAMVLLRPGTTLPFLRSFQGMACIAGVLILMSLGAFLIRKIIRIDV
jgi:tight adherence protein B